MRIGETAVMFDSPFHDLFLLNPRQQFTNQMKTWGFTAHTDPHTRVRRDDVSRRYAETCRRRIPNDSADVRRRPKEIIIPIQIEECPQSEFADKNRNNNGTQGTRLKWNPRRSRCLADEDDRSKGYTSSNSGSSISAEESMSSNSMESEAEHEDDEMNAYLESMLSSPSNTRINIPVLPGKYTSQSCCRKSCESETSSNDQSSISTGDFQSGGSLPPVRINQSGGSASPRSSQPVAGSSTAYPSGSSTSGYSGRYSSSHQSASQSCSAAPSLPELPENITSSITETPSYPVYKILKPRLKADGRQIDYIRGDGNCFFRALSKDIYGTEEFHDDIRQAVVDLMEKYPSDFKQFLFSETDIHEHIEDMRKASTWASTVEIYAAATLLQRDIYILSPNHTGDLYNWLLFSPLFTYNRAMTYHPCHITLCHTHGNHYDRITQIKGKCNCGVETPILAGVTDYVDLTV